MFEGLEFAKTLPHKPGVYKMYKGPELLYVGKAKDLHKRVLSYFTKELDARLRRMTSQITHIDTLVVPTEVDALVLESRLIKKEHPKYNIQLKDDKGYPYIFVDTSKPVPTIAIRYGIQGKEGRYFGPFPSRQSVYEALDTLRQHFKIRTCTDMFFNSRKRPCLEYQIQRCSAPCVQKISSAEYKQQVDEMCQVLEGKSTHVIKQLSQKMEEASDRLEFERAKVLRDKIISIRHVQSKITVEAGEGDADIVALAHKQHLAVAVVLFVRRGQIVGSKTYRFEKEFDAPDDETISDFVMTYISTDAPKAPTLIVPAKADLGILQPAVAQESSIVLNFPKTPEEAAHALIALESAEAALQSALSSSLVKQAQLQDMFLTLHLPRLPERVECFDISHIQGQDTVASKVVFGPQGPIKSQYRRYNIANAGGNDLVAMREALMRRFAKQEFLPDVLLIDGGLLQLQQATEVLAHYKLDIPCIGVAKGPERIEGEERLVLSSTGEELAPGPRSPALQFIQAVRNEAHRFAIEGHRKKRSKRMVQSVLDTIEGVGPSKRKELLHVFGGLEGLKKASLEQLSQTKGVGPKLGQRIFEVFHPS